MKKPFAGRKLVLATMHGKERVLRSPLQKALGVQVVVPAGLNTDLFGTFSGEVERVGSPLEAARRKCGAAAALTGEPLVLASEGSFGSHPVLGFVPANEELLLLKDVEEGWEIKAKATSTSTNFSGAVCNNWDDALLFASKAGFPSHGLIVRAAKQPGGEQHKGIQDWHRLKTSFNHFHKAHGTVYIETDMRAHQNPTRLKIISEACEQLLAVVASSCPQCGGAGFAVNEVVRGLPCSGCSSPTQSAKAHVYRCQHCGHEESLAYPRNKHKEDPMFCDVCNP